MRSDGTPSRARALAMGLAVSPPTEQPAPAPAVEVRWQAPEGCPDGAAVRSEVERVLRRPLRPDDPRLSIAGIVSQRRDGVWQADLLIDAPGGSGTRTLEADACADVSDAAAFVIAVMIDPDVLPPPEKPEPLLEDPFDPTRLRAHHPSFEPAPRGPRARPRTKPRSRLRFALRAHAAVGVGPLPSVAPGTGGVFALVWPTARIEIGATYWFARAARVDSSPPRGGDIRLLAASARGCWTPRVRKLEIPVCGGLEAGSMHGRGVGIDEITTVRLPWVALLAGPALAWVPVRWFALWLEADLVVPVTRPDFTVLGLGRVHRAAPAAFAGMLGLEARFP